MPLFLYLHSDRSLVGVYEATGHGQKNMTSEFQRLPAQVAIRPCEERPALRYNEFISLIQKNVVSFGRFNLELDHEQVGNLLSKFGIKVDFSKRTENLEKALIVEDPMSEKTKYLEKAMILEDEKTTGEKVKILEYNHKLLEERVAYLESFHRPVPDQTHNIKCLEDFSSYGVIFAVGGHDTKKVLQSVEAYSLYTNVTNELPPMPVARRHCTLAILNDKFFIFGGIDANRNALRRVEVYDPLYREWSKGPALKKPTGYLAAATIQDKIYALGGTSGEECLSNMQMFEMEVGQWFYGKSMLEKRCGLSAVALNNAIYAVGGYDGEKYLSSAERFDPREKAWNHIASMNAGRRVLSLVTLNEKIYALGGFDETYTRLSSVEVYDPRVNLWSPGDSMKYARASGCGVAIDDVIYMMGGLEDASSPSMVELYKEGEQWESTNLNGIGMKWGAAAIAL